MAADCVCLSKGGHNRGREGKDGNVTHYIVCNQLYLFISVGYHHGLGDDAKPTRFGARVVCWWRCSRIEIYAQIMCAFSTSTETSLWGSYFVCDCLCWYYLALFLDAKILWARVISKRRRLYFVYPVPWGVTVSCFIIELSACTMTPPHIQCPNTSVLKPIIMELTSGWMGTHKANKGEGAWARCRISRDRAVLARGGNDNDFQSRYFRSLPIP